MSAVKSIIALALMAATSAPALAESIDVKVIGTIAPVACTPTLSGGGVIDYGNIPTNSLSQTAYTTLAVKQIDFAITCDAPAKVALKALNGRPGTIAGATEGAGGFANSPVNLFIPGRTFFASGLGMAGQKKIGGFSIRLPNEQVSVDGKKVDTLSTKSSGEWFVNNDGDIAKDTYVKMNTWAKPGTVTPLAFTTMAGKLDVQAYINKASELDLTQPITLDGLTTIELVYL
jgi:type 1 fimbria pilin